MTGRDGTRQRGGRARRDLKAGREDRAGQDDRVGRDEDSRGRDEGGMVQDNREGSTRQDGT